MDRRKFLQASVIASATTSASSLLAASAAATPVVAQSAPTPLAEKAREFYLLRRYHVQAGPQAKLTESYFGSALIPALRRLGLGPIGAFRQEIGPDTPMLYLLVPGDSVERLAMLDLLLAKDAAFLEDAAPFWDAPAREPAYGRVDSTLLAAFAGWPRITPPAAAMARGAGGPPMAPPLTGPGKRLLQLRTYESPTDGDHVRKVEMFHSGEFRIFEKAGFDPVFFGDALIGQTLPSLTYMLSFADMDELNTAWEAFGADAAWKKLSADPRYSTEQIVSNVSNLILRPLAVSQV